MITALSQRKNEQVKDDTLLNSFVRRYDVVPAATHALKKETYRLRYQIYCTERKFENPEDFPSGLETDQYDSHSVHSLLFDRKVRSFIGTVRIVLPFSQNDDRQFPLETVCSRELFSQHGVILGRTAAEISRFSISKELRRSFGVMPLGKKFAAPQQRPDMQAVTIGLLKGVLQMSIEQGVTAWCAVMEPALLRLLARFGIHFKLIGPLVEYHGIRQPCYTEVAHLLGRLKMERPDVWDIVTDRGKNVLGRERQSSAVLLRPVLNCA